MSKWCYVNKFALLAFVIGSLPFFSLTWPVTVFSLLLAPSCILFAYVGLLSWFLAQDHLDKLSLFCMRNCTIVKVTVWCTFKGSASFKQVSITGKVSKRALNMDCFQINPSFYENRKKTWKEKYGGNFGRESLLLRMPDDLQKQPWVKMGTFHNAF